jgi:hypothetical protein
VLEWVVGVFGELGVRRSGSGFMYSSLVPPNDHGRVTGKVMKWGFRNLVAKSSLEDFKGEDFRCIQWNFSV